MVRITKISAGILLLILSIILMIKTGFQGFISALIGNGAIGSAAGIVLAITFIVSAIVYILTNRTYSLVPDIISFVIIILGAAMGIYNANLPDTAYLNIWSWIGIVIGAIVLITSIVDLIVNPVPDDDEYESQNQNDNYMRNQQINYDQFQQQQYNNNNVYQSNNPYSSRNDQQFGNRSRSNNSGSNVQYPNSNYQGNALNNQQNNPYQGNGTWNQYNGNDQNNPYANNQQQRSYGHSENGYRNKNLNNSSENNYDGQIRYDPSKSRRSRH